MRGWRRRGAAKALGRIGLGWERIPVVGGRAADRWHSLLRAGTGLSGRPCVLAAFRLGARCSRGERWRRRVTAGRVQSAQNSRAMRRVGLEVLAAGASVSQLCRSQARGLSSWQALSGGRGQAPGRAEQGVQRQTRAKKMPPSRSFLPLCPADRGARTRTQPLSRYAGLMRLAALRVPASAQRRMGVHTCSERKRHAPAARVLDSPMLPRSRTASCLHPHTRAPPSLRPSRASTEAILRNHRDFFSS